MNTNNIINNILGARLKSDNRSKNKKNSICPKCGNNNFEDCEKNGLDSCTKCGYILQQGKALSISKEEQKKWSNIY